MTATPAWMPPPAKPITMPIPATTLPSRPAKKPKLYHAQPQPARASRLPALGPLPLIPRFKQPHQARASPLARQAVFTSSKLKTRLQSIGADDPIQSVESTANDLPSVGEEIPTGGGHGCRETENVSDDDEEIKVEEEEDDVAAHNDNDLDKEEDNSAAVSNHNDDDHDAEHNIDQNVEGPHDDNGQASLGDDEGLDGTSPTSQAAPVFPRVQGAVSVYRSAEDAQGAPLCSELAKVYQSLRWDFRGLVNRLFQEHVGWGLLKQATYETRRPFCSTACAVLLSIHPLILEAIIQGELPAMRHENPELKKALQTHRQRAIDSSARRPVIYINYFVNRETNRGFLLPEVARAADLLELYLGMSPESAAFANKIDNAHRGNNRVSLAQSAHGHRRYLSGPNQVGYQAGARLLVERMRRRMHTETEWPLAPFTEVGYTIESEARKRAHATGANSNRLMTLLKLICDDEWPQRFQIQYHDVYCIPAVDHAAIGEIVITMLAHAYTQNGGGLNCFPAGLSVHSAETVTAAEWEDNLEWNDVNAATGEDFEYAMQRQQEAFAPLKNRVRELEERVMRLKIMRELRQQVEQGLPADLAEAIRESEKEYDDFVEG